MANAKGVRRLVQKALRNRRGLMRTTALIQMLIHTACLFAMGWALTAGADWALAVVLYAFALTSLMLNGPAVAAARDEHLFARLTPKRFLALCALSLLPLLPGGIAVILLGYVNREWLTVLQWAFTHMAAFVGIVCAIILIELLLALFSGVFTRQMAIYLLVSERVHGHAIAQACKNGVLHIFSPLKSFFTSFGWFLGMTVLLLLGVIGIYWAQGQWIAGMGLLDQTMMLMAFVMSQPTWMVCAALALTFVWVIGLGFYFWPRYLLKRVYIQRSLMRDSGMMSVKAAYSDWQNTAE